MTKYAIHIAFGLGIAIMLGGCGMLLNVAPAGGTPLNQPSSYRAPTLTAVPDVEPPQAIEIYSDGSYSDHNGIGGCIKGWPCDESNISTYIAGESLCPAKMAAKWRSDMNAIEHDELYNEEYFMRRIRAFEAMIEPNGC